MKKNQLSEKRIVFHIGWPKTGSTAIQNQLFSKRQAMLEKGWYFPPNTVGSTLGEEDSFKPTHAALLREIAPRLKGEVKTRPVAESVIDEFDRSGCSTMVLSNENVFWLAYRIRGESLPARLRGREIKLITYARRYDEYVVSLYKQRVKVNSDFSLSIERFADSRIQENRTLRSYVDRLANVFDTPVQLRAYDLAKGNLIEDFQQAIGLSLPITPPEMLKRRASNASVSNAVALFIVALGRTGAPSEMIDRVRLQLRRRSSERAVALPVVPIASSSLLEVLRQRYNEEVRELRAAGLADLPEAEARPPVDERAPALTLNEFRTISQMLRPGLRNKVHEHLELGPA